MTAKCCVRLWTLLAVLLAFGQSASAALWQDPAAIPSYRGSTPFSEEGKLDGFVDYAVYAPGDYSGSAMFRDLYVYAYQISNNVNSTVGVDYFSIGLSPNILVRDVADDPAMSYAITGGSIPSMHFKLPESVIYIYLTDNIGAGERSLTLLFTSNYAPEMGYGYASGGSAGGAVLELPSPVPEPATFTLIGAGTLLAFRRRRKS